MYCARVQDRYKIRDAFTCEPGNTLVVADYGQLELRVLAHMVCRAPTVPTPAQV